MKFRMKFVSAVYALVGLVVAITLTSAVINILILAEVGRFVNASTAVTAVSLVCSIILFAVCVGLLTNAYYVFSDKSLVIWFGFLPFKFPYDTILAAAEEPIGKKVFLQYKIVSKKKDFDILAINIDAKYNADFLRELFNKNPQIKDGTPSPSDNVE